MAAKKVLLDQYDLHNLLFNNVVADINDEESAKTVADPMNSVKWLAGHLVWAQRNFARMGGVKTDIPWVGHFLSGPGSTEEERNAPKGDYPTFEMIVDKWNEIGPAIKAGLEKLPEAALDTVIDIKHPITPFDNTLGGLWAFINHHQAYTIGQIGILRRGLGKEAMKYS
jgi:hypothetical protein